MKRVIFDCDNTMGVVGCDVDDGLALLYLLGKPDIQVCGITTTYGNSDIDTVYTNTDKMLREIGRMYIPLLRGCTNPQEEYSEAAQFIVDQLKEQAGKISILATGSLTNLYAAHQIEPGILNSAAEIVLMGGITHDLIIGGKLLAELNFSCDPAAAQCVLTNGNKVSVITGNNCLDAFFTQQDFAVRFLNSQQSSARYIENKCQYWFNHMQRVFGLNGFHNWDVVAAAYLAQPDLFNNSYQFLSPIEKNLRNGFLKVVDIYQAVCKVNFPFILDIERFTHDIYQTWLSLDLP